MTDGSFSQQRGGKLVAPPNNGRSGARKRNRLLRHADFERVYKQGKRHFAANMTVFYLERDEKDGPRIGYTVSRALGGAVQRNRMKRRLREAVRLCGLPGVAVDIVVNPKKTLLTAEFLDVRAQIARAMQIIGKAVK